MVPVSANIAAAHRTATVPSPPPQPSYTRQSASQPAVATLHSANRCAANPPGPPRPSQNARAGRRCPRSSRRKARPAAAFDHRSTIRPSRRRPRDFSPRPQGAGRASGDLQPSGCAAERGRPLRLVTNRSTRPSSSKSPATAPRLTARSSPSSTRLKWPASLANK